MNRAEIKLRLWIKDDFIGLKFCIQMGPSRDLHPLSFLDSHGPVGPTEWAGTCMYILKSINNLSVTGLETKAQVRLDNGSKC